MDRALHHARPPVPGGGCDAHELSFAEEHAADARERVRGARSDPRGLCGGDRGALSVLQLRGLHVHQESGMSFELVAEEGGARAGRLTTAHGVIETPAFMPVGTAATVKAMNPEAGAATGARIVLGHASHLMLRPGAERIATLGGLHRFMNWPHAILTDSGGFQVMSLAALRKITEEGVAFRSHLDGSSHLLTPERSVEIQHLLGADITMAFDECTAFPAERDAVEASMELSMRWARRS